MDTNKWKSVAIRKEIVELADLVTEMKEIKHPFKSGIKAKKGIDF